MYNDPWKLLLVCMLLNKTAGCQVNLHDICFTCLSRPDGRGRGRGGGNMCTNFTFQALKARTYCLKACEYTPKKLQITCSRGPHPEWSILYRFELCHFGLDSAS